MILSRGRDLDVITSVEVIERPIGLGERVSVFSHACHLAEITSKLSRRRRTCHEIYRLLSAGLSELEQAEEPWLLARWFEMGLLALTGYRLDLYRCVNCGNELLAEPNKLGIRRAECSARTAGRTIRAARS